MAMLNNVETEAKFIIPDLVTFDALQQITHLDDFEITPIGVKNIVDRYLDTPDKHLLQAGFVCRIRDAKDQQILTLKSSLKATTGEIHRRQELEMEVKNDQPLAWAESEVKNLVLDIVGQTPLQNLFTLYQTRHKFHVSHQEKLII
jgi:inorganic triphosphatase YgiF